ncbi:MAG: type II secretion system F family protein [Erysipelotrichaceae bacterium]|nr:type II secretion system F family protein [Erysipelotrichaceae bacterium]
MASLKLRRPRKTLSLEDMTYLSKLLKTNLSISECFELLGNKDNVHIFRQIREKLAEGEMIESIMTAYLPKQLRSYLESLLKYLPFSEALSLSLEFCSRQNESQDSLLGTIAYPCILLFITVTSLYLFDLYGLDSMFDLMGNFSPDIAIYGDIRIVFRIMINIIYYGFLIGVLGFIYMKQPKRIVMLYILISKHLGNSLFNLYYSEQFMSLLLICHRQGFKTRESLQILKSMKSKPIVSFLAFHLDDGLSKGDTMKEAAQKDYYDSSLSRYIKMAGYTNDFANIIASYLDVARERIRNKMKMYALTIQICTYGFIGAVIVFIYQLLFMPMQAITLF